MIIRTGHLVFKQIILPFPTLASKGNYTSIVGYEWGNITKLVGMTVLAGACAEQAEVNRCLLFDAIR